MPTTLWNKHQYARCFGNWVVSDPECIRCALADNCEKRTKARIEEDDKPVEPENNEIEAQKEISPLDYLLKSLDGKFDQEIEEKEKAVIHKFKKEGKTIIAVAIGAYGKIKIISMVNNRSKIFGRLENTEEVETVLAEML